MSLVAIILIAGLLMYAFCKDPKLTEVGRIMFAFALLALLLGADKLVSLVTGRALVISH